MIVTKALTLKQPWASLIAGGHKKIETRSWRTSYRGPLAIHASKKFSPSDRCLCWEEPFCRFEGHSERLPLGSIIAVCTLRECRSTSKYERERGYVRSPIRAPWVEALSLQERAFGDYSPERWGWFLDDVRMLPEPIPCKGSLGLWDCSALRIEVEG